MYVIVGITASISELRSGSDVLRSGKAFSVKCQSYHHPQLTSKSGVSADGKETDISG